MTDKVPPALEVGALFHSDERLTAEKTRLKMVLRRQMRVAVKPCFCSPDRLILLGFINTGEKVKVFQESSHC